MPKQRQTVQQLPEVMPLAEHAAVAPLPAGQEESFVAIDPLEYPGWDSLLAPHASASIFHGAGWARVLHETYGHTPVYLCQFDGGKLVALLPIMEVSSRLTGRRGVSLPFTDFCPALKANDQNASALYHAAMTEGQKRGWKYLECRSDDEDWTNASTSLSFYGHVIDLRGGVDEVFKRLDSSVRRGIRKAEGAGLQVEFSSSRQAMQTYYALHCQTRRRHGLPPQPFRFFENIQRYVLEPGQGFVVTVRLKEQPIAAGMFFCYGRQGLYKFGASDFAFQQLRPNNLMMWAGIRHCVELGMTSLHLGRTSLGNEGLRRFKMGLGATEEVVKYSKYDFLSKQFVTDVDRAEGGWFNRVFASLPLPFLRLAGQMLYPHLS
ncbi:MAG TPA: GNAT family N-acetyltransferase [Candidatus Saccharimonadales bacterium]|nr:GNAT family N-acetyltransferase [Candidatus Saccharimonadales bacterium]